jgi:hypothetical protein
MRNLLLTLTVLATFGILGFASSASANVANHADPKIRIGSANIHIVFNNGIRYERFHYYPGYDVYYSYHSNRYYWYERGRWYNARKLPIDYRYIVRERYIVISARHDRPWTYHDSRWRYDNRNDRWDRRDNRNDRWDRRDDRRDDRRYDRRDDRRRN